MARSPRPYVAICSAICRLHTVHIYKDRGTVGLDALYDVPQQQVDKLMTEMRSTRRSILTHAMDALP